MMFRLVDKINRFARLPQTSISLKQMVMLGHQPSPLHLFRSSQFLQGELAIRIAHQIKELEELPPSLKEIPSIVKVKDWYSQSFQELIGLPSIELALETKVDLRRVKNWLPSTLKVTHNPGFSKKLNRKNHYATAPSAYRSHYTQDNHNFCSPDMLQYTRRFIQTIETIKKRHGPVVANMGQGFLEYQKKMRSDVLDTDLQKTFDRFYLSRIGIRVLIGQHSALYKNIYSAGFIGIVSTKMNAKGIVEDAINNARFVCEDYYDLSEAPKIHLSCSENVEFMYIPSHLNHIVFELLKNSLRAVVERFGQQKDVEYPPIKVFITHGKQDITIKISDEGGGISRSSIPNIWNYSFTTAKAQKTLLECSQTEFKAPMAGFGYGLPISRLYARYFGGDLKLASMEGHGTNVYIHLNRLSNSNEALAI